MAPLTTEDRFLITALRTGKLWSGDRMITDFPIGGGALQQLVYRQKTER